MSTTATPAHFKLYWTGMRIASRFSTRVAGYFAARLWFTPWPVDAGERGRKRQREWLASTDPISLKGGAIAGFTAGTGPTVLLVHGWGERAASMGAFIEPLVGAGYRVVGIDLPGHGDSAPARPNAYVIADAIRDAVEELGGVTAVVAHSLGAHSTLIALNAGLDVASVVMLAPSSRLDHIVDRFAELLSLPRRAHRGLELALERRFGPTVWAELDGRRLISNVTVRAFVAHDLDDPQVPFGDSEELTHLWPGAHFMATRELGHGRILRDGRVIGKALGFLAAENGTAAPPSKELASADR